MSFREARKNAGLSVKQVCEKLGVSDASVYFWESGINIPRGTRLLEVAELYGVTVDDLLRAPNDR